MQGKLIALYGINNIGKTTQAHSLVSQIKAAGFRSEYLKYPVYDLNPTGKKLNEILRGKKSAVQYCQNFFPGTWICRNKSQDKLSQLFKYRAVKKEESVKQKISEEELQMWYTLNRYQYQPELQKKLARGYIMVAEDYIGTGLAWGSAKGADLKWLEIMNRYLLKEDLSILLDGKRFLRGKEQNHLHESNDELVEKCRDVHLKLGKKYKWQMVNANQPLLKVEEDIWKIVKNLIV